MNQKLAPIVQYLSSLSGRADLVTLESLIAAQNIAVEDVAAYSTFNEKHYARNKVASGEWFDLFVMCWRPGQSSAIHDHRNSSCAFLILEGTATEVQYDAVGDGFARPTIANLFSVGELCCAQDEQIHRICNVSSTRNLVTMHIYTPPLAMTCYEEVPALMSAAG